MAECRVFCNFFINIALVLAMYKFLEVISYLEWQHYDRALLPSFLEWGSEAISAVRMSERPFERRDLTWLQQRDHAECI